MLNNKNSERVGVDLKDEIARWQINIVLYIFIFVEIYEDLILYLQNLSLLTLNLYLQQ